MSSPFQLLPALSADEYLMLKADIEANGVRVPIRLAFLVAVQVPAGGVHGQGVVTGLRVVGNLDDTLRDLDAELVADPGAVVAVEDATPRVHVESLWRSSNLLVFSKPPGAQAKMEATGDALQFLADLDWRIDGEDRREQVLDGFLTIGQDLKARTYLNPDWGLDPDPDAPRNIHLKDSHIAEAITFAVDRCIDSHPELESTLRELVEPVIWTFSPQAQEAGLTHGEGTA